MDMPKPPRTHGACMHCTSFAEEKTANASGLPVFITTQCLYNPYLKNVIQRMVPQKNLGENGLVGGATTGGDEMNRICNLEIT